MKLSEFKEAVKERLSLVKASTVFTFQKEVAYAGNNWGNIFSTTFYTLAILIFIKVLYSNINTIAGYSYNEMLFYFLVGQITYYSNWIFTLNNVDNLIVDVNKGNLDLVLIKPVPSLFYLMTRNINLLSTFTDAFPPTIAIVILINWPALALSPINLIIGCLIWFLGIIILHVFQLISALPVFWLGESESITSLVTNLVSGYGTLIPLEGYSQGLRLLLGTLVPILITTSFTVSVSLGKSNAFYLLIWTILVTIFSLYLRQKTWDMALKNYTSASS